MRERFGGCALEVTECLGDRGTRIRDAVSPDRLKRQGGRQGWRRPMGRPCRGQKGSSSSVILVKIEVRQRKRKPAAGSPRNLIAEVEAARCSFYPLCSKQRKPRGVAYVCSLCRVWVVVVCVAVE